MPGPLGIRRPIRFLAHKLDLDREQVARLAEILDDLRTERAQADVDGRRAQKRYAEALKGDVFDAAGAAEASKLKVAAAERTQTAWVQALRELHELLEADQRQRLAVLLRAGPLSVS